MSKENLIDLLNEREKESIKLSTYYRMMGESVLNDDKVTYYENLKALEQSMICLNHTMNLLKFTT